MRTILLLLVSMTIVGMIADRPVRAAEGDRLDAILAGERNQISNGTDRHQLEEMTSNI